jgi:uncharacterized membrane protein YdfJ with MMPL/SSD domain
VFPGSSPDLNKPGENNMRELLTDAWALVMSIMSGLADVVGNAVALAIAEDPFWRGVEITILVGILVLKRKKVLALIDRVPVIGAALAFVPAKLDMIGERIVGVAGHAYRLLKSKVWDNAISWIKKIDSKIRKNSIE